MLESQVNNHFSHTVPEVDGASADPAVQEEHGELAQLRQRLLQQNAQLDAMQSQLDRLTNESQLNSVSVTALVQKLTDPQAAQTVQLHLAEIATRLAENQERLDELMPLVLHAPQQEQVDMLARQMASREQVSGLEQKLALLDGMETQIAQLVRSTASKEEVDELAKSLGKLSRTQFKSNALGENKEGQITGALATLQEIINRREAVETELTRLSHHQREEARAAARGELIADLLPVLDGLELALASGRQMPQRLQAQQKELEASQAQLAAAARQTIQLTDQAGVWRKVRQAFGAPAAAAPPNLDALLDECQRAAREAAGQNQDALDGWLQGLELVRDRFLKLLAAEGVQPIMAQGQPFDPHLHVALETAERTDLPADTIVNVLRPGYRQNARVLRYAEVVVARGPQKTIEPKR